MLISCRVNSLRCALEQKNKDLLVQGSFNVCLCGEEKLREYGGGGVGFR